MTETTADAAPPVPNPPSGEPEHQVPPSGPGTWPLFALGVAWLAAVLLVAHASIAVNPEFALITAAIALPIVIATSVLAGAVSGLAAATALTARRPAWAARPAARGAVAVLAGALVAGAGSVGILIGYGTHSAVAVLAGAVCLAGGVGGALGAVRPVEIGAAGLSAALAVLVAGFTLRLFKDPLLTVFGAGESAPSRLSASGWFALTEALVSGVAAGLVAFWHLRRAHRRTPDGGPTPTPAAAPSAASWPRYLAAGATPGLVLLLAEAVTRLGGARLLALAGSVSELDRAALRLAGSARINHALVVLFVGAVLAVVAFGRTLPETGDLGDGEHAEARASGDPEPDPGHEHRP